MFVGLAVFGVLCLRVCELWYSFPQVDGASGLGVGFWGLCFGGTDLDVGWLFVDKLAECFLRGLLDIDFVGWC